MPTSTKSDSMPGRGLRVLYVDDAAGLRSMIRILLEDNGYEVETAEDGSEAWLRICAEMKGMAKGYELVITDLDMRGLDEMELIQMVRKVGFPMRLMVYTGKLTPARRIVLKALAVDVAVEKGIESEQWVNLIDKIATESRES